MPADQALDPGAGGVGQPDGEPVLRAAPAFVMMGSDDVGVCVDGVCALPGAGEPAATP